MRVAVAVGLRLAVFGAIAAMPRTLPARAEPSASKVIDRTVSCAVGLTGGLYKVQISANTGTRLYGKPSVWKYLASASAGAANGGGAGVQAGNPAAPLAPGLQSPSERLSITAPPACKSVRQIPLSKAGLVGTPVPALAPSFGVAQCAPVRRVVVRVRGVFTAPTSLHVKRYRGGVVTLVASGTVVTGYLAVRSASGKPLAYAEVFQNGKARLFVARSCTE